MLPINISTIKISDFQNLIIKEIPERKTIEYKQQLKIVPDQETKEFLADVSSFANDIGGDLIYGITEDNGLPKAIVGIEIINPDALKRQLDSIIRDGLEPRISGIQIETFHLTSLQYILLIRIPKSYTLHQIVFKGSDKFYSRGVAGKYKLDVHEIKSRFLTSQTIEEKLKAFKDERISKIASGKTPVSLLDNAKIVLHLIPLSGVASNKKYDISSNTISSNYLFPLGSRGFDHRYNMDGLLADSIAHESDNTKSKAYLQLFRNGIIETINADTLAPYDGQLFLPSLKGLDFEQQIIQSFKDGIALYKSISLETPIYAFLTFLGIKGYVLQSSRIEWRLRPAPQIDVDILSFSELIIQDYSFNAEDQLKPVFDMIWNACGVERSRNYDGSGKWIGPK